jgi:hypothetical protein
MKAILMASTLLLTGPALAVDYVQCREMLRTKDELIENAVKAQGDAYGSVVLAKCGQLNQGWPAEQYSTYESCIKTAHASYKKSLKPYSAPMVASSTRLAEGVLFDPVAIRWYKAAKKVVGDMTKGGCPYQ